MEIVATTFHHQTDVVSQRQFDEHLKLYQGYVSKTNEITKKLAENPDLAAANATYSIYRGLKRGESYALDGVILHEMYFQNLVSENAVPGNRTLKMMELNWGGYDQWKAAFIASATSARGWCITAFEQRTQSCRNIVLDSHDDGLICGSYPLIVIDMYEHAYFLDYATDKAKYINNFIDHIPWTVIEKRVATVMR